MKRTTNYALPTWEKSDFIQMSDFNDAFGKIDAQMKKNDDKAANGLTAEAAARQNADAAVKNELTAELGTTGYNCRAVFGSYTGTGNYGDFYPCEIVTGFKPIVLLLAAEENTFVRIRHSDGTFTDADFSTNQSGNQMTWGDDRISWYNSLNSSGAKRQANVQGVVYYYVVLGYDVPANS